MKEEKGRITGNVFLKLEYFCLSRIICIIYLFNYENDKVLDRNDEKCVQFSRYYHIIDLDLGRLYYR